MINRPENALARRVIDAVEPIAIAGGGASVEQMPPAFARLLVDATQSLLERFGQGVPIQLVIDAKVTGGSQLQARIEFRLGGEAQATTLATPQSPVVVDLVRSKVDVAGQSLPMAPRDIAVLAWILHARQTGDNCTVRDRLQSEATARHRTRVDLKVVEMGEDRCTRRAYRRVAFFRLAAGLRRLNEGFPLHWFGDFNAEVEQLADQLLTKDIGQALARVRRQLQDAFGRQEASRIISFGRESFASAMQATDIRIVVPADLSDYPELPLGVDCAKEDTLDRLLPLSL